MLRDRVDELIREQLRNDQPARWAEAETEANNGDANNINTSSTRMQQLVEEGRRSYAFYLCSSCEDPYFGGTVDCIPTATAGSNANSNVHADDKNEAAANNNDNNDEELPPGQANRLCPACRPQPPRLTCRDPARHRGHHVHKCRYCCRPSSFVCYGNVHLCEDCHAKNGQLVAARRRRGAGSIDTASNRPQLEAQPCPGGEACPHPMPAGQDRHSNGPGVENEQVYCCAWCDSDPTTTTTGAGREPGSRNFITNSSGQEGMRGWRQLNPRMAWEVERDANNAVVVDDSIVTTCFVSSYDWCVMAQQVPLHQYVADPASVRIEVAAQYTGRTDCPSVFRMEAVLLDVYNREIGRKGTDVLDAPQDAWERTSVVVEPTAGLHSVVMIVYGKDRPFWQGRYGSKVADCCVRVLCSEEELPHVLAPAERETVIRNRTGGGGDGGSNNQQVEPEAEPEAPSSIDNTAPNSTQQRLDLHVGRRIRPHQDVARPGNPLQDWARNHALDILLPLALALFAWVLHTSDSKELNYSY